MASYPRQIPAGGEGIISIKVNTNGYGGHTMQKSIEVFTSDSDKPRITLSISGQVLKFVDVDPRYVRLVGAVGTQVKKTITIQRQKGYPFTIRSANAKTGKEIAFLLEEFGKGDSGGYSLTVENLRKEPGRYTDTLILLTDSPIKSTIRVPVYGQIFQSAVPGSNQSIN